MNLQLTLQTVQAYLTPQRKFWIGVGILAAVIGIYVALRLLWTDNLNVRWDAVPGAVYYTVHCGQESHKYTHWRIAPSNETTFTNVAPGRWYCAVTATNRAGLTSSPSAEVIKEIP